MSGVPKVIKALGNVGALLGCDLCSRREGSDLTVCFLDEFLELALRQQRVLLCIMLLKQLLQAIPQEIQLHMLFAVVRHEFLEGFKGQASVLHIFLLVPQAVQKSLKLLTLDGTAVPNAVHVGAALDREAPIHCESPSILLMSAKLAHKAFDNRFCSDPSRPDYQSMRVGGALFGARVHEINGLTPDTRHKSLRNDFNTVALKLLLGVFRDLFVKCIQHTVHPLHDGDLQVLLAFLGKVLGQVVVHVVVQLCRKLNASGSTTDDHKMQQPASLFFRCGRQSCLFEVVQDALPDGFGIFQ
mmetsp:Transcript_5960/g.11053  ORF Transcript_5960/g.11053 Transcript_5960/m.11053 type:complete len:299 (-) Transcript_5960:551-1447(-)